jgi:hypothetical protein
MSCGASLHQRISATTMGDDARRGKGITARDAKSGCTEIDLD